jgi:DNA invertase Pin-like site-specific DNA recombinase
LPRKRPALDALVRDAKRRKFDIVVCWRLDRLGRNLKHLITLLEDLQGLGVAFVSLSEGIDATTPAGKLQMHILASIAEFERKRIRERVLAGLQRARAQGRQLGRPKAAVPTERLQEVHGRSLDDAARALGVTALLDRLLHHAHVLKCGPKSWRTKVHTDLRTEDTSK